MDAIVLYLCEYLELQLKINFYIHVPWIPIVSYTGEIPALSLLLIFQVGYLGVHKNNLAFTGISTKWAKS